MSLKIPENGLQLESSAKAMAALPLQAFSISLSDSDLEDMIACVQNGQDIQLALGSTPSFVFGSHEVRIKDSEPCEFDLFYGNSPASTSISRLENPTMSIFDVPKSKRKQPSSAKAERAVKGTEKATTKASAMSPKNGTERQEHMDEATAKLINDMAKAEQEKADRSTRLLENVVKNKNGTVQGRGGRLMGSHPGSPALTGLSSPSLKPADGGSQTTQAQERDKQQRFLIIHELALDGQSFSDLREKLKDGTDQEFSSILNKVADFDDAVQKYVLKKIYWNELDVFEYPYAADDRKKAIDYLVKQYDRKRIAPSDTLWQKLLPTMDRGKGICISKLKPRMIAAQAAAAKSSAQKPDGSSASGGDSERDDSSGTANGKKGIKAGGEPMSRTNSNKKASSGEVQMKRILSGGGAKKAATAKASPKPSPTKTAPKTAAAPKNGFKSKEFVSDSSDDDEVPLAKSKPAAVAAPSSVAKVAERLSDKSKSVASAPAPAAEKPREAPALKPKRKPRAVVAEAPKEKDRERVVETKVKEKDTIEALAIARPSKPTTSKRARENDDDDSSSSGTPMIKRVKSRDSHPSQPSTAQSKHAAILAREKEREREREREREARRLASANTVPSGSGSVAMKQPRAVSGTGRSSGHLNKPRTNSPRKSSPLASSPPTNVSDLEPDRPVPRVRDRERDREQDRERERERERDRERDRNRERARERERERERDRETAVSSASSTNGDSSVSSSNGISAGSSAENSVSKKRKATSGNSSDERHDSKGSSVSSKRPRLSPEILSKANKFKQFYSRYEALHMEIIALEDPPKEKMDDLLDMRSRLCKMKSEIYREVSMDR